MTLYEALRTCLEDDRAVAVATIVSGPEGVGNKLLIEADGSVRGFLEATELLPQVTCDAVRLLKEERVDAISYDLPAGVYEVFIDVFPVLPQVLIVGASDIAIPLSRLAKELGYRVVVTDARGAFVSEERFPDADLVLKGWPQDVLPRLRFDPSTYVVLLSHDPRFDEPTLDHVLKTEVRYIGTIGSRKTQQQRRERLREAGFGEKELGRIYGPVGLDIGGRSAEETALAILAEITAVRYGKQGGFKRGTPFS